MLNNRTFFVVTQLTRSSMHTHEYSLLEILGDGVFHSGEDLGRSLNVSRTAIWKQIRKLKQLGLEIESVSGRGYCLAHGVTLLNRQAIREGLSPQSDSALSEIDLYLSIDSTNSEAMRRIQKGAKGRQLIVAEQQLAGRGRRGRAWLSPMARNVYMSLIWPFDNGITALEGLSLVIALSLVRALQELGLPGMEHLRVKWPNDVWLQNKKLAGILLELQGDAQGPLQVVIGIGLNVNMPLQLHQEIQQPVTDLSSNGNFKVDRNRIVTQVVSQLDKDLRQFSASGFAAFKDTWHQYDVFHGQTVEVTRGNNRIVGKVTGVDATGALVLSTPTGIELITGGEVFPSVRVLPKERLQ
ncbi:MAG: bifunctional biotin--[acetyl-CoA-carboxylase] ligase/biotin operon repressor BirA [Pseudohongiellaceae bacterium]